MNYIHPLFAFLMILTAITFCFRLPYHAMIIAAGHFKQTRLAAYGEAVINIVLSLILVYEYGLIGVALATLAATWFRFVYYIVYLSKNIFDREVKLFIKRLGINILALVGSCLSGYGVVSLVSMDNYWLWAICGGVSVIVVGAVTLGLNFVFFKKDCRLLIKKFVR